MAKRALLFMLVVTVYFFCPLSAEADAFLGEGKDTYVKRCVRDGEFPGLSKAEVLFFCQCAADNLESSYQRMRASIKPTDTVEQAQQKMDRVAQEVLEKCWNAIEIER